MKQMDVIISSSEEFGFILGLQNMEARWTFLNSVKPLLQKILLIYEDEEEETASEKKCLCLLNKPWLKRWLLAKRRRGDVIKEGGNDVLQGSG